jgi:VWFA-related protein
MAVAAMLMCLPPASPQPVVGRRVDISVTASDVSARRAGELSAGDFEVKDNGKLRRIENFEMLRPSTELVKSRVPNEYTESNRPLSEEGSQQPINVVLIDTAHLDPEFQPWAVAQAAKLFSLLRSGEDVALYEFTRRGLTLRHEFSHSALHLLAALAPRAVRWDAASNRFSVDLKLAAVLDSQVAGDLERDSKDPKFAEQRFSDIARALADLAGWMRQFPGRKNLFWISSSFPPISSSGLHNDTIRMLQQLDMANVSVYPVEVRSAVPPVPFLTVEPGSELSLPMPRRRPVAEQLRTMQWIAGATGGKAITNRSQLGEALFDAMQQTRFSYLLTFNVLASDLDGQFHRLQVSVKRRGVVCLARQTYFAGQIANSSADRADSGSGNPFDRSDIALDVRADEQPDSRDRTLIVRVPQQTLGKAEINVSLEKRTNGRYAVVANETAAAGVRNRSSATGEVMLRIQRRDDTDDTGELRVRAEDRVTRRIGSVMLCRLLSKLVESGNSF